MLAAAAGAVALAALVAMNGRRAVERQLDRALGDHATYAARLIGDQIGLRNSVRVVATLRPDEPHPDIDRLWSRARDVYIADPMLGDVAGGDPFFGVFVYDCAHGRLTTAGGASRPAVRAVAERAARTRARAAAAEAENGMELARIGDEAVRVVIAGSGASALHACTLEGLTLGLRHEARAEIPRILRKVPVLPSSFDAMSWTAADSIPVPRQSDSLGLRVQNAQTRFTMFDTYSRRDYAYAGTYAVGSGNTGIRIDVGIPRVLASRTLPKVASTAPTTISSALVILALVLGSAAVFMLRHAARDVRERQVFLSKVSHELRTPLTQLRLHVSTLQRDRVNDAARRRAVDAIERGAEHLTDVVENLLVITRAQLPAWKLHPRRTDVAELLRNLIDAYAPVAARRGATVVLDAPARLDAVVDASALRQAALNVLDNAIKYGPPEQIVRVTVRLRGDALVVRVIDQGPGIPLEQRSALWEPFSRLQPGVGDGAGLGLAVVREIVTAHHGRATISDGPGGGTAVEIEIPGGIGEEPSASRTCGAQRM